MKGKSRGKGKVGGGKERKNMGWELREWKKEGNYKGRN